ncbi:ABC transporter substrate-binding protein [Microbacterium sp. E-13]|uniref:ABC transporter substrate-binding protein n=1 Tax=Microbacterium sp. E-13 TaxID=3404048 RepID=UPI003CF6F19D
MYTETGFPLFDELAAEFERQYPNVTFDIINEEQTALETNAPRLLSGDDAPDFVRLDLKPDLVRDGLLLNLQPYAEAYGWTDIPASLLAPNRVNDEGTVLGEGDLYGFGATANLTGVFYNRALAERVGMEEIPSSVEEFEAVLADAKDAGILPIVQSNAAGTATLSFQSLADQYVPAQTLRDWIFNTPGASIETDGAVEAADRLQTWMREGYINADTNAVDYTTMVGRFVNGEALFMILGNWQSAGLAEQMGEDAGFFLFPAAKTGGSLTAASVFGGAVIPARAKHPDAAAYFLNWMVSDPTARQLALDLTGMVPPPVPGAPDLEVVPGTTVADGLEAFDALVADDGAVGFLDTATSGLAQDSMTPLLQMLLDDRISPEDFIAQLQADYEEDLDR